jgi:polyisoprenoid-binding protein YceI
MSTTPVARVLLLAGLLVAASSASAQAASGTAASSANYVQAPGSMLAFAGSYQGQVFTGRFPQFNTRLSFDPAHPEQGSLDVSITLANATTANADYDDQMRGDAFFNVARYPQAHYAAKGFRSLGGNRYATDGTLSLHGISKPVTLQFTWTPGAHPVLAGKATVKRLDFGIGSGDWADTDLIPDAIAVSTRVILQAAR